MFVRSVLVVAAAGCGVVLADEPNAIPADQPQRSALPSPLFEITPFIGYMAGGAFEDATDGGERDLDSDKQWGVFLNAPADDWRHYELLYAKQSTQIQGAAPLRMNVQYLQIGGTIEYPDAGRVIPYFGLTAGGTRFSPGANGVDDATKFSFSAGGGVRIPVTDHFGLRFDARAFVTLLNSDTSLFCVTPDAGGLACRIRGRSDTFIQYAASLGFSVGF